MVLEIKDYSFRVEPFVISAMVGVYKTCENFFPVLFSACVVGGSFNDVDSLGFCQFDGVTSHLTLDFPVGCDKFRPARTIRFAIYAISVRDERINRLQLLDGGCVPIPHDFLYLPIFLVCPVFLLSVLVPGWCQTRPVPAMKIRHYHYMAFSHTPPIDSIVPQSRRLVNNFPQR